jgi:hypothetical protein
MDRARWENFLRTLDNPVAPSGWTDFSVRLTDRGIYFCDHSRSQAASVTFRRVIDWVLSEASAATVEDV